MAFHEQVLPDEGEKFERFARELRELQQARRDGPYTPRGLHAKQHVGAVGQLTVPELPPEFRVAVFAQPRTWPLYARFSNGSGQAQHDGVPDVRGIALKLVGVPGRKLIPGLEDRKTQDFLFIQVPSIAFRSPEEFVKFVKIAAKGQALLLPRLIGEIGLGRTFTVVKNLASMPKVRSMATAPFYTAAAVQFGATAAKLALFPVASDAPRGKTLRDDLVTRLASGPIEYSLRAQLFVDDATTPIEDVSVPWRVPFVEIGRVTLPRQEVQAGRGKEIEGLIEKMSFDPWHAVEELRPLGAVMRARAPAYRESALARGAAAEPEEVIALE